jgi:hypothetical protein
MFTREDPGIWVVYPPGAAGDLLISIIDKHYLRTGCEYYGINDHGRVMLYTSDYEMIDIASNNQQPIEFDEQWFYNFSDQLGNRNLTYSMLDQIIFGCHLYRQQEIQKILDTFSQARIINIYAQDRLGESIIKNLARFKLQSKTPVDIVTEHHSTKYQTDTVPHERVLNVPFGFLFGRDCYDRYYTDILKFLGLPGPLICFEYIEFYLSKQNDLIRNQLKNYSQTL